MTAEAQRMEEADLVKIEIQTSAVHAEIILRDVLNEVTARARQLLSAQETSLHQKAFGTAVYVNHQINKCLTAAVAAKQLLDEFTTQGEEEHGNEV